MAKLLATDGEGERLDRFELIAELASGGMATVFLARLSGVAGFQRLVAIKRLHPHLANEPEFVEMFLDEARLAARIHHPNVVPIQEVGESSDGYYLVMDYVEGDTLARLLARAAQSGTHVPLGVTVRILLDTLAGLHAAHELTDDLGQPLAIVHRDVSPQNILVGADGITRITDFGVARAAARLSTTRSGQLKGKLAYMAPEQARGVDLDRRADLFSCGIVLWEALTRKRLFRAEGEASTLNRVLNEPIVPPSTHRPEIAKELDAVCMRALERDVDGRFATADAFADELERVARRLSCVGSVRDVTVCLEQVFGAELSQQREAVRAWLARSEPSGSAPRSSSKRLPDSVPTRVEKSNPNGTREEGESARVDRQAVTAPAPSAGVPETVSSVTSAVLHLRGGETSAVSTATPSRAAVARWGAAIGIAALVVVGVSWGAMHLRERAPDPVSSAVPAAAPAAPPEIASERAKVGAEGAAAAAGTAPAGEAAPPDGVATGAPVGAASAGAAGEAAPSRAPDEVAPTRPGARPAVRRPGAAPKPSSAVSVQVPDDLSRNPYR